MADAEPDPALVRSCPVCGYWPPVTLTSLWQDRHPRGEVVEPVEVDRMPIHSRRQRRDGLSERAFRASDDLVADAGQILEFVLR